MSGATDAMLARLTAELEEREAFQNGLVEAAQSANRDLNSQEMELYERAGARMVQLEGQLQPLREGARIAVESARRTSELANLFQGARGNGGGQPTIEYRSAGAYIAEMYYAQLGDVESQQRLEIFHRAAAHQTTTDNPGLLPESIVGPVVNFVDESRPLVSAIGPVDLGEGSWSYARVTQHTQIGAQSAEKAELPSRKMLITKTPITAPTLGGYVNVSRQDIRRSSPGILDMVISDLSGEYAIESELATGTAIDAAAVAGPTYPTTGYTAADVAKAIYGAAGQVYTATRGQGRVIVAVSPDMLGVVGPLFPPINPQNAFGQGFSAAGFQQGNVGQVSGLTVVMSAGLPASTIDVFSTAAVKVFEYKYGNLQVVEPSVWGVQVGYAGDFQCLVVEANGVRSIGTA